MTTISVQYFYRLINMGLRGLTLVSKFCLLLFLAIYLDPKDVGLYGLMVATVAYGTYPLGFEFYTYSTREMIKTSKAERGRALKNQVALHGRLYMIALPLFVLIFYFGLLPWQAAIWFFLLVVLEHACQEMMRLLVALEKQLIASVALFMRQGLWALIVIVLMYANPDCRVIESVLVGWVLGAGVAAIISGIVLYKELKMPAFASEPVDWSWVRRGLKVAIPMFLGTLSLNFIMIADKYWFEALQGVTALGGYVFFMSISAAMMSFLEAGVFSFIYPAIVAAHSRGDKEAFNSNLIKMLLQTVVLSAVFIVFASWLIDFVLVSLQRDMYLSMKNLLYIFLLAMFFQALSYVPHYALYAQNKDRAIIISHVVSVPVFVVSVALLSKWDAFYAVPVGVCFCYAFMLALKYMAFRVGVSSAEVTAA